MGFLDHTLGHIFLVIDDIVECGVASLPNLQCLFIGGWVWVEASRVVWQEDSLFLFFFTLVMDILCGMVHKIESLGFERV